VEEAFRTLKGDLSLRPIWHQKPDRIEAHLFLAFLAYTLHSTLRQQLLRPLGNGLTPRTVLEKLTRLRLLDLHAHTTDTALLLERFLANQQNQPPKMPQ
ncbi:MAG: hypothetical protein LBR07_04140, partial [Puniceicoccales bacterium]|nr:hypothetical protein [Puniceicoccales bacterium]